MGALCALAWCVLPLLSIGCSVRSTGPTEVGVRTHRLFGSGIEQRVYPPGTTFFFAPFLADWATFDINLQNLIMAEGAGIGPIEFKTHDGNDISVDVTVSWRIDPARAPQLLARMGPSTEHLRERLVRPVCRSVVRDVLNELHSEEYYVSEPRFAKAGQARERLNAELAPEGIIIELVLLGTHRFNREYEKIIHARKLTEQNIDRLRSESAAAAAAQQRDLETAHGDAQVSVTQAQGEAAQVQIAADSLYYQREREARAALVEHTANAKTIERQRQAMSRPGGHTAVKLSIAEALSGKNILIIPSAAGAALQQIDLNGLIEMVKAAKR